MTDTVISAAPDWSLERAAVEMSRRHIRHLVVVEGGELVGVLSMRDIVRVWTSDGRDLGHDLARGRAGGLSGPARYGLALGERSQRDRGEHRGRDPLLARQADEVGARVADPGRRARTGRRSRRRPRTATR